MPEKLIWLVDLTDFLGVLTVYFMNAAYCLMSVLAAGVSYTNLSFNNKVLTLS